MSEDEATKRRAQRTNTPEFIEYMTTGWQREEEPIPAASAVAPFAAQRRAKLAEQFPGEILVFPAGPAKVRSNDTDYRFRAHSAFAHLTGLGGEREPRAVLVLAGAEHTLYLQPMADRTSAEFFSSAATGEFWIGPKPTLAHFAAELDIAVSPLVALKPLLLAASQQGTSIRVISGIDPEVDDLLAEIRPNDGAAGDQELDQAASELRLVKDAWEVSELRAAIAATHEGFNRVLRTLPQAKDHHRGERVVETEFFTAARTEGNGLGYDTIAASGEHATILHWISNDGPVRSGDLLLLDAGVEMDSLYTADITRTVPVDGTFSAVQRRVYEAVLDAADAGFAAARPGNRFRDVHAAAMNVIAERLAQWGVLPVSVEESLTVTFHHRRWMVHGTSHHLGLDVHDCAQARNELYMDGILEPGMVFTIEPGLYFKSDDALVPAEFRGIGVRIEDDVLITADGVENLSAALPRKADDVEAWVQHHLGGY